ncbi:nucleoporin NUP35-like isoform X2 [Gigantopelta aegis]|nr:nucleoporin NUP35-like isoform X2 [Gigantopelta aegis]
MLSSPTSPGAHQYLPAFLLGENTPHTLSPAPRLWSAGGHSGPNSGQKNTSYVTSQHMMSGTPRNDMSRGKDKAGAPPVKGLFVSPDGQYTPSTPSHQMSFSMSQPQRMGSTPASSKALSPGVQTSYINCTGTPKMGESFLSTTSKIPVSPAQLDPFYTQGDCLKSDDVLDETWVTVFGFVPSSMSFILQQFAQYGDIIKYVAATEGNWMHIHYKSRIQAKKALSKNGKIFEGTIMVGVLPCIDKNILEDFRDAKDMSCTTPAMLQTANTPSMLNNSSIKTTSTGTPIRPLAAAYRSRSDVLQNPQEPKRDNSFVSKVKEYVLGW